MAETNEELAFDLLREVVTKARNDMPYKDELKQLEEVLNKAPGVRLGISQSLFWKLSYFDKLKESKRKG